MTPNIWQKNRKMRVLS